MSTIKTILFGICLLVTIAMIFNNVVLLISHANKYKDVVTNDLSTYESQQIRRRIDSLHTEVRKKAANTDFLTVLMWTVYYSFTAT